MSWKTLAFEDCLEKIKTPPKLKKSKYLSKGKFPVIAQEDSIINGYTNDENLVFKVNSPIIIFGDHTRKLKFIDFNFVLGADGAKIIKPKSDINVKFFFYYLIHVMPKNIGYARHYKLLKKIRFNIPSLPKQQSIVAKLDSASAEIDRLLKIGIKKKEETKLLIEKIGDNIFNDLKKNSKLEKLSSIVKFENGDRGKNYPSKKYQLSAGIPFINAGDLSLDGEITQKGMVYLSVDRFNLLGAGKIELNDILFCLRGSLGKCALNKNFKKGAIASSLVIMRPEKKRILPKYLLSYLRSSLVKEFIKNTASGTAQPNLSAKIVSNYEIPLPSIEIQELVINKIEKIKEEYLILRKTMSQKRDELQKLLSSFVSKEIFNKAL